MGLRGRGAEVKSTPRMSIAEAMAGTHIYPRPRPAVAQVLGGHATAVAAGTEIGYKAAARR